MSENSNAALRPQPGGFPGAGGEGTAANNAAILECLAELKLLTAANNDATALTMLIAQMEQVCEKLLASNTFAEETNTALMDLCQKMLDQIEADAADSERDFTCLQDIKTLLTCQPQTPLGVITYWN